MFTGLIEEVGTGEVDSRGEPGKQLQRRTPDGKKASRW